MTRLSFRLAADTDCRLLYELYMEESTNPYLAYEVMGEAEFLPIYKELLASGMLYVAEAEGKIVGSFHLIPKKHRQSGTVYLSTFAVFTAARGKGYARQILQHIIGMLRAQDKNRIELEVSVNNDAAIALYKSVGFEIEGRIRQSYYFGDKKNFLDDYLMGLLLNQ